MIWTQSYKADPAARPLADRHYNRHKIGADQFVPPGRSLVLLAPDALWITSWPKAEYVRHAWAGCWVNTLFRNEGAGLSSDLIRQAVAATRWYFGDPPAGGIVSFIDPRHVRRKRDYGRCYRRAGWSHVGFTKDLRLWVLELRPDAMPPPEPPRQIQPALFPDALHHPDWKETPADSGPSILGSRPGNIDGSGAA